MFRPEDSIQRRTLDRILTKLKHFFLGVCGFHVTLTSCLLQNGNNLCQKVNKNVVKTFFLQDYYVLDAAFKGRALDRILTRFPLVFMVFMSH